MDNIPFHIFDLFHMNIDGIPKGYGGESQKTNTLDMSFIYQDQRIEPCNLCSSINYGGRDIYPHYHSTQNDGRNSLVSGKSHLFIFLNFYVYLYKLYQRHKP